MDSKYQRALSRNLNEVRDAWFELRTLFAIDFAHHPFPNASFFHVVRRALFSSSIGHLLKLLDRHKDATSFWYIYKFKKAEIEAQPANKERIKKLEDLAKPLRYIRDKTHFHIDGRFVGEPQKVWDKANVTYKEIHDALLDMLRILQPLLKNEYGAKMPMDYDESEAKQLAMIAKDLHIKNL